MTRYKPYDELARLAGRQAGLADPTPEAVAAHEGARAARDKLWAQYERRLRDTQTHTLDDLTAWLGDLGCRVGRSSIARNRRALIDREEAIWLAAERARAVMEAATAAGVADVLAGGTALAAQVLFEALSELPAAALRDLTGGQIIQMIDVLGRLRKTAAETDLIGARVAEMQRRFDEQMKAATAPAADGRGLTPEQIAEIRRAVFGDAA